MKFDLTTFILEMINFAVLVWVLKRLFYKPVKAIIEKRRSEVEAELTAARRLEAEASATQAELAGRVATWEAEKAKLRARLDAELEGERERRLAAIEQEAAALATRHATTEQRERDEARRRTQAEAVDQAGGFCARLLARLASPALEARLVELFLDDLGELPAADRERLRTRSRDAVVVTSAFALPEAQRTELARRVAALVGDGRTLRYQEDQALLAGVAVDLGGLTLDGSLRSDLRFFTEAGRSDDRI